MLAKIFNDIKYKIFWYFYTVNSIDSPRATESPTYRGHRNFAEKIQPKRSELADGVDGGAQT